MRTTLTTRNVRRLAAATAVAAVAVIAGALPASAHVEVTSPDAEPGGFAKLVFSVPNETTDADTTEITVHIPTDTPLASVSTKPLADWTITTKQTKLDQPATVEGATITKAVTSITWLADKGKGLAPGQFGEFELSVGPLPEDTQSLSFPTTQTYSNGDVVQWNQPVKPGTPEAQEPESPAPTLALTGSSSSEHSADTEEASASTQNSTDDSDATARILSGVAVVLGAAALLVALRPRPRKS